MYYFDKRTARLKRTWDLAITLFLLFGIFIF
jgi:hypothetical protein